MGSLLRSFKKRKKSRRLGEVEVVMPDDLAVRSVPLASAHSVVRE